MIGDLSEEMFLVFFIDPDFGERKVEHFAREEELILFLNSGEYGLIEAIVKARFEDKTKDYEAIIQKNLHKPMY